MSLDSERDALASRAGGVGNVLGERGWACLSCGRRS